MTKFQTQTWIIIISIRAAVKCAEWSSLIIGHTRPNNQLTMRQA